MYMLLIKICVVCIISFFFFQTQNEVIVLICAKRTIPPITTEKLVDCLYNAFANGATSTKDAIHAIYGAREHIWSHVTKARKKDIKVETVHTLLLQLIATSIVEFEGA